MKRLLVRHVVPVITMIVGVAGVFWCIMAMNQPVEPPKPRKARQEVRFAVEQKKPPKKPKPKRVKRRRVQNRSAPPTPVMQSSLAGPSFDLPSLGGADLTDGLRDSLARSAKAQVFTADTVDKPPSSKSSCAEGANVRPEKGDYRLRKSEIPDYGRRNGRAGKGDGILTKRRF